MEKIKQYLNDKYIFVPAIVLFLGLVASISSSKFLFDYTREQHQLWIERHAEAQSEQLQISISSTLNTLASISAFFQIQGNINQEQFLRFIESDTSVKAGILAIAWVPRVKQEDRKQFERDMDKHLRGYKSITEINSHGLIVPAPIKEEYFPVQHLFTTVDTEFFTGLNLAAQFRTRKDLNTLISAGQFLTTQARHSSLRYPEHMTFHAYYPVYNIEHDNVSGFSAMERLAGFVLGLFDIQTLVSNTFHNTDGLDLILFDIDSKKTNQLLYKSNPDFVKQFKLQNVNDLNKLQVPYWTRHFNVGNRHWMGVFFSDETINDELRTWIPYAGLIIGTLITSLLAMYLFIALVRGKQIHHLQDQLLGSEQLVTSQQHVLNQKYKQTRELESVSNEKTRYLHALGHDLRQPLSTLGLYFAQLNVKDNKNKNILDKIKLTLKSLNTMFESLIEMARLEAGTIKPNKQLVNTNELFLRLFEEFELPMKQKGLEFRVRINNKNIYTDPVLFERILRNLITNAIKYTDEGKILLASRSLGKHDLVYVIDTGPGIDEYKMQEVFNPYTRGTNIVDENGLGLGLAIVVQTINLLKHKLDVSSTVHKGTCFKIIINKP